MLDGYLTLDSTEIINHARLDAYINEGMVPGYQHLEACGCPTLTPAAIGPCTYLLTALALGGGDDRAATPDHASLDITGDLDIRWAGALTDWTPAGYQALVAKWGAFGTFAYVLELEPGTGKLIMAWSVNGSAISAAVSSVAPVVADGGFLAIRATLDVNNGAAGHTVTFYTKAVTPSTVAADIAANTGWTTLGTAQIAAGVTSIGVTTSPLTVGALGDATTGMVGRALAAQVRSGIDGTVVASPDFSRADPTAASFVDGAGRTWTPTAGADIACQDDLATDSVTDCETCPTYVSPAADPAPWYDATVPASAEFAGFLMLSMTGHDTRPTRRTVTNAITGGGVIGPARVLPRTIVVSGVLLGSSCCGVSYGLSWLGQALAGCGTPGCEGADMGVYSCCPSDIQTPQDMVAYQRTIRRVALVEGPTVTRRAGDGCRSGCTADVLYVEFILTAADPWLWSLPVEVLDEAVPTDDGSECVTWVADSNEACRLAACTTGDDCRDPTCTPGTPPSIPSPTSCFCQPIAVNSECYDLDISALSPNFEALPLITVTAGNSDLRRATITIYERTPSLTVPVVALDCDGLEVPVVDTACSGLEVPVTDEPCLKSCDEVIAEERCNPHSVYHVGYVPAGGTLLLDGQTRQATIDCGVVETASDVWGREGSPLDFAPLGCGKSFCVCLEADALFTPAADAGVKIELSAREV